VDSVNENLVIFSRYNNDAHAGQRVIFQVRSFIYIKFLFVLPVLVVVFFTLTIREQSSNLFSTTVLLTVLYILC
jgi:hypothetical protein